MNKYWAVKVIIMIVALVGVLWLMQSLKNEPHFEDLGLSPIPAKVITQPPKSQEPTPEH